MEALIGSGANLGKRESNLTRAWELLALVRGLLFQLKGESLTIRARSVGE